MTQVHNSNNFRKTQTLGEKIGKKIKGKNIFALYGNLGSGKTTFVQGLAKGLGINNKIISPTFIIVRRYDIPQSSILNLKSFYHIDLYRVESENDINGLGLEEILNDPSNVVAIEWPEKIKKLLPKNRTDIFFEYIENDKRIIRVIENL